MSDERARKVAQLAEQARQMCWEIERLFGKGEHLAAAEELYMVLNGLSRHFAEPAPPTTEKVASEVGEVGAREFVESWLKERIGGPGWWPITRQETSSLLCSFYADVAWTHRGREERNEEQIRELRLSLEAERQKVSERNQEILKWAKKAKESGGREERLLSYAQHKWGCAYCNPSTTELYPKCDCGLAAIRKEVEG